MITSQLQELEDKENELKKVESSLSKIESKVETSKLELLKIEEELKIIQEVFQQHSYKPTKQSELDLKDKHEELSKQYDDLKQNRIDKDEALKQRDDFQIEFQKAQKELNELTLSLQKEIQTKEQLDLILKSSKTKLESLRTKLKSSWQEYKIELDIQQLDMQYQILVKREELYSEALKALSRLESDSNKCNISKIENETQLTSLSAEIKTLSDSLVILELSAKELLSKRVEVLNVADLDEHEKEIISKYKIVQEKEQILKANLAEFKTKETERDTSKEKLTATILEDEKKLNVLSSELEKLYAKNGFKDALELEEATLNSDDREKLSSLCSDIEAKFTQTQALKIETVKKLHQHQKEPIDDRPKIELEILQDLLGQKIDALAESIGSVKKELELNEGNSDKHKERFISLQKKKDTFKVWVKLNELSGSADGTKFKKFAQGITLDQLINLANQHLSILSTRYTLSRNQEKLLELEIIDAYQGNVIRPVSTLSGGESFIVSLALALGLSELASQKIAIDSLFLDEGFGTLDEESLETALNALNLLQSGGKMVGVISHVEALKERIPLQIKIIPNGDGTSTIDIQ